jgi:hypothetical protein
MTTAQRLLASAGAVSCRLLSLCLEVGSYSAALVCVGIPFAERGLFINIAMILWTFNILKSPDVEPNTAAPFQYSDNDAAFDGNVRDLPVNSH